MAYKAWTQDRAIEAIGQMLNTGAYVVPQINVFWLKYLKMEIDLIPFHLNVSKRLQTKLCFF